MDGTRSPSNVGARRAFIRPAQLPTQNKKRKRGKIPTPRTGFLTMINTDVDLFITRRAAGQTSILDLEWWLDQWRGYTLWVICAIVALCVFAAMGSTNPRNLLVFLSWVSVTSESTVPWLIWCMVTGGPDRVEASIMTNCSAHDYSLPLIVVMTLISSQTSRSQTTVIAWRFNDLYPCNWSLSGSDTSVRTAIAIN